MTAFNPKDYLINLKGKQYLQVTHRLMWFREVYSSGSIITEAISIEPIVFKATILDNEGRVLGTGHGSATTKANAVWSGREVEKAETAAIGRALATAGFGTQFADGFEDDEHPSDTPISKPPKQAATALKSNGSDNPRISVSKTQEPAPAPSDATVVTNWWTDKGEIAFVKEQLNVMPGSAAA